MFLGGGVGALSATLLKKEEVINRYVLCDCFHDVGMDVTGEGGGGGAEAEG